MKFLKIYIPILFATMLSWDSSGQSIYEHRIQTYLTQVKNEKSLQDQMGFVITDEVIDQSSGLVHIYVEHTIDGLPMLGNVSGFHFNNEGLLRHVSLRLPKDGISVRKQKRTLNSEYDVLTIVADLLDIDASFKLEKNKQPLLPNTYYIPQLSSEVILLREALIEHKNAYIPVWEVGIYVDDLHSWQVMRLDMNTGASISKQSWTHECFAHSSDGPHTYEGFNRQSSFVPNLSTCDSTYQVFAYPMIGPNEGGQSLVTTPWTSAAIASPNGWHNNTLLNGNNVLAVEDTDSNNNGGYTVDGGASLCFPTTFDDTLSVFDNLDASLTNAFYWNNLIHDVMYNYGFDESAGNFQKSNFDRGGKESDRVTVDILDGSGKNNANFSSPPDGLGGRMQMFEWIPSEGNLLEIHIPGIPTQSYNMLPAIFGPHNLTITDTITIADPILGCDSILNDNSLLGQIAMIDRGDCDFVSKTLFAQTAGAIAVIVCNSDTSDIFSMGGEEIDSIYTPTIMVGKTDCDAIKVNLDNGIVEATITIPNTFDSGLDNGILVHEYAHGISTRLTGGPSTSTCLTGNEQMGEGWSDWYALMFSLDASDLAEAPVGIGSYVLGQDPSGNGIRNYPYSTDLLINPVTYNNIKSFSIPHGVGSVWASMLWDMTWNLIDNHGFDPDIYNGQGGNNIALRLVTLALKLQPCDPGFVDGRDAILAADLVLYDGANACAIWKAFANRGLGLYADQGSSISSQDGDEDFTLPEFCARPILYSTSSSGIAYAKDTISVNFDIRTNSLTIDSALICADLPYELAYYSGEYDTIINDTISFLETTIDSNSFTRNTIDIIVSPDDSSSIYYLERVKSLETQWTFDSDLGSQSWEVSDSLPFMDSLSFFCKNVEGNQTQFLTSPNFTIEGPTLLGFWHYYNLENNWDGAFVELSIDNGLSWIDIGLDALSNGYNSKLKQSSNDFSEGRFAYTGTNEEYQQTIIDLSPYSDNDILLRFTLASDRFAFEEGWYIDNISLYHKYEIDIFSKLDYDNEQTPYDTLSIAILPQCEPCDKDLCDAIIQSIANIDQDITKAFQYIESDATLSLADDVQFIAGDSILLRQDFTVPQQAVFRAIIDQCIKP